MKHWTVRLRIILAFGAVVVIILALAVVTWQRLGQIEEETTKVTTDSLPGLSLMYRVSALMEMTYGLGVEHLITAEDATKRQIETDLDAGNRQIDSLLRDYQATIFEEED